MNESKQSMKGVFDLNPDASRGPSNYSATESILTEARSF